MFYAPFCFDYFQIAFSFWFFSTLTCQSCLLLPPTRPEPREGHFHLPPVSPLERPPGPVATCHQAIGNCTQIDIKNFATSQFNCSLVSHVLVGGNPPLFYSEMFLWGPLQATSLYVQDNHILLKFTWLRQKTWFQIVLRWILGEKKSVYPASKFILTSQIIFNILVMIFMDYRLK